MMKRLILATILISATLSLPTHSQTGGPTEPEAKPPANTVQLTVDYADGAQKRFPAIPWKANMCVLDATAWASRHPRGIRFKQRGRQAFALVTQIDDLVNGSVPGKNWLFRVNGKLGDKSCGVFTLQPGDRILWSFEQYK